MNLKDQGVNAERVFHGESVSEATRQVYGESATLFSNAIRSRLDKEKGYRLADFGSHRGEFLKDLISLLPEYKFWTIAIDVNADDLEKNKADQKIVSDLSKLSLPDRSVDVTVCRYVLAWNDIAVQKEILREIKRITKRIIVIQHQGANSQNPVDLQKAAAVLFSGIIPSLKRENFFFSTAEQIESMFNELGLNFEKIQTKEVLGLSDVFIDKYNLSEYEALKTREILKSADHVTLSTWAVEL